MRDIDYEQLTDGELIAFFRRQRDVTELEITFCARLERAHEELHRIGGEDDARRESESRREEGSERRRHLVLLPSLKRNGTTRDS